MTLEEMKREKKLFVLATDVADILGMDPQSIRAQAKMNPAMLGFPVVVVGTQVRIPRRPFLRFLGED